MVSLMANVSTARHVNVYARANTRRPIFPCWGFSRGEGEKAIDKRERGLDVDIVADLESSRRAL